MFGDGTVFKITLGSTIRVLHNFNCPAVVNNQLYCFGGTDNGVLFQGHI